MNICGSWANYGKYRKKLFGKNEHFFACKIMKVNFLNKIIKKINII
jgi:hypothetical protein